MSPSTRSATRAFNNQILEETIRLHNEQPNIAIQDFKIEIVEESTDGVQTPFTGQKLTMLFNKIYTHLTSQYALSDLSHVIMAIAADLQAGKQYKEKFNKVPVVHTIEKQITHYLETDSPKVIFMDLDKDKPKDFIWGVVWKADEKGQNNEIYLSKKLLDVFLGTVPPPSTLSSQQTLLLQAFHQFAISVTFLHETIHCLTKYLFPGIKTTPLLSEIAKDPRTGLRESGTTFEFRHFKFVFELALERSATGHKLWQEKAQVVARFEDNTRVVLDVGTLQLLNSSFNKELMWDTRESLPKLSSYTKAANHVRYRIMGDPEEDSTTEKEPDLPTGLGIHGLDINPWRCGRT